MRGILRSREFIVFVILILISVIIGVRNPLFFSAATLFDLIRGSIVYCIMALGVLMVLVSGNVDISFVAIAAMTSYTTHMLFLRLHYEGGILFYLLLATSLGFGIGFLMGVISTRFQLPVFYVSLGYQTLWYGFTLFFLGRNINFKLPKGLVGYYSRFLFRVKDPIAGESGLHVSVLYLAVITLFIFWLLNYTAFGRGLYAMGGTRSRRFEQVLMCDVLPHLPWPAVALLPRLQGLCRMRTVVLLTLFSSWGRTLMSLLPWCLEEQS